MIEGSVPLANETRSRRPKNIRIRIRNTGHEDETLIWIRPACKTLSILRTGTGSRTFFSNLQVFRIKLPTKPGERGRFVHRKDINQVDTGHMSLNCIRYILKLLSPFSFPMKVCKVLYKLPVLYIEMVGSGSDFWQVTVSVGDLWHFGADPDPRIRTSD
jgi:hypothetical protein